MASHTHTQSCFPGAATTLNPEGGIGLQRDNADPGLQAQARQLGAAAAESEWWMQKPPRGLVLTLHLPWLLPRYPEFTAMSKAASGLKFTLLSRFCIYIFIYLPELL